MLIKRELQDPKAIFKLNCKIEEFGTYAVIDL